MAGEDTGSAAPVLAAARAGFERLSGRPVESVRAVTREEDGWRLGFEVVELARIPDSTSLIGSYEVLVDREGNVLEFDRVRRYHRNRADEEL